MNLELLKMAGETAD